MATSSPTSDSLDRRSTRSQRGAATSSGTSKRRSSEKEKKTSKRDKKDSEKHDAKKKKKKPDKELEKTKQPDTPEAPEEEAKAPSHVKRAEVSASDPPEAPPEAKRRKPDVETEGMPGVGGVATPPMVDTQPQKTEPEHHGPAKVQPADDQTTERQKTNVQPADDQTERQNLADGLRGLSWMRDPANSLDAVQHAQDAYHVGDTSSGWWSGPVVQRQPWEIAFMQHGLQPPDLGSAFCARPRPVHEQRMWVPPPAMVISTLTGVQCNSVYVRVPTPQWPLSAGPKPEDASNKEKQNITEDTSTRNTGTMNTEEDANTAAWNQSDTNIEGGNAWEGQDDQQEWQEWYASKSYQHGYDENTWWPWDQGTWHDQEWAEWAGDDGQGGNDDTQDDEDESNVPEPKGPPPSKAMPRPPSYPPPGRLIAEQLAAGYDPLQQQGTGTTSSSIRGPREPRIVPPPAGNPPPMTAYSSIMSRLGPWKSG
eukprot:s658_g37.t1